MSGDTILIKILWVVIVFAVLYFLWQIQKDKSYFENFESSNDVSEQIIKVYYDTLNRSPCSAELKKHTKAIFAKEYDYNELELRIINSDEYQRLIKTQTNGLQPETTRIIEEKDLIDRIKRLYLKVRNVECPTAIYLPLKDLYIHFNYNIYKFVALLRDTKYTEFEDAIKNDPKLSRESLIELYHATFDDAKLNYDASAIQEMDNSLEKGKRLLDYLESDAPTDASKVNAMAMLSYLMKNMKDDEDRKRAREEEERLQKIREATAELEKQRRKNAQTSTQSSCTTSQRVYLPDESKIVKNDYGLQVLQKSPPICTTLATQGGADKLPDVIVYNGLQGTNLADAVDTQVGSIMPRFEYKRYIDVPLNASPASA